jgi:hypothetical protein
VQALLQHQSTPKMMSTIRGIQANRNKLSA